VPKTVVGVCVRGKPRPCRNEISNDTGNFGPAGVAAGLGTMNPDATIMIGEREGWGDAYPFGISPADHCHHMYIIGKTGSGKTTLLRNLLIQHIARGHECHSGQTVLLSEWQATTQP
jgi:hypothetical protein